MGSSSHPASVYEVVTSQQLESLTLSSFSPCAGGKVTSPYTMKLSLKHVWSTLFTLQGSLKSTP